MPATTIRRERDGDAGRIGELLRAAFRGEEEALLVEALRSRRELAISLLACDANDGGIAGHVAFSPVVTAGGQRGLGLAPLAVWPQLQRRGTGSALVAAGLDEARRLGAGWVVVLGDPLFYARFGFGPASRFGLVDEYQGGDAFQVLGFDEHAIPRGAGTVHYASAFDALSGEDA